MIKTNWQIFTAKFSDNPHSRRAYFMPDVRVNATPAINEEEVEVETDNPSVGGI
jgi:hypothetical protein